MANSDVNMPDAPPPDGVDDSEPLMEAVEEASTPDNAGMYAPSVLLTMLSASLLGLVTLQPLTPLQVWSPRQKQS